MQRHDLMGVDVAHGATVGVKAERGKIKTGSGSGAPPESSVTVVGAPDSSERVGIPRFFCFFHSDVSGQI